MAEKSSVVAIMLSLLVLVIQGGYENALAEQNTATELSEDVNPKPSYISVNVGVELRVLEEAAKEAALGITLIGESLDKLANNPELTQEQRERVAQTLIRVDHFSANVSETVNQMPDTMEKSLEPVVQAGDKLVSDVKSIIIITALAIVLIILIALAMVYHFVLAPGTKAVIRTTSLLDELASTLETTAEIVETSSKQNLEVIQKLQIVTDNQYSPTKQE